MNKSYEISGGSRDGATEAHHTRQSGQHQWADATESADQSESGEKDLSLTLLEREYSYKGLKSWWQNMEQKINQCACDDGQMHYNHNGIANCESAPNEDILEPQEDRLQGLIGQERDAEVSLQIAEPELEDPAPSGRKSMQATPEALFLAEKLQQLADTTRKMAQHLLSPEASRSRRVVTADSEALGATSDMECRAETSDVELMRQKILLLDEVVEELSQYRLSPLALDMTERFMGESPQSPCLRNERAITCNNAIVESSNSEGEGLQQELDLSNLASCLAEDTQNTVAYVTESLSTQSSYAPVAEELSGAGVKTKEHSGNAEVLLSTIVDDPPPQHFPADGTADGTRTSPVLLAQQKPLTDSPGPHSDACSSNMLSQERRFSTCHGKEAAGATQQIRSGVSKQDGLDRVTATAQRLLRYPILVHALNAEEMDRAGGEVVECQPIPWQVVQSDMVTSVAPSQQEPRTNFSGSHLGFSTSDLLSQELRFNTCQGSERSCKAGGTAYQGQEEASQPSGIDGMIALVQRLLRLNIMGHAQTPGKTNAVAVENHSMPWQFVQSGVATAISPSQ
ncbi:uncharacterized protein LOC126419650 [Schistocerca serialis cubense]|uniref:uncharacterized protein LOC126419650 n=1 Tax=Schistocerca serialis cubense TaxID=2023355 RepID=UPI00214E3D1E|nr:uncharacterized protein LOC126419650 [Schistocerca serialis cubense]